MMRCCELKLTSLWLPRCEGDVSDPAYALEISRTHFAVDLVHSFMGDFTLKLSLGPPSVVDDGMPFSTQLPRWASQTGAYCVRWLNLRVLTRGPYCHVFSCRKNYLSFWPSKLSSKLILPIRLKNQIPCNLALFVLSFYLRWLRAL